MWERGNAGGGRCFCGPLAGLRARRGERRGTYNVCLWHGMAWTVGSLLHMGALGGAGEAELEAVSASQMYLREISCNVPVFHCDSRYGSVLPDVANLSLDSRSVCPPT